MSSNQYLISINIDDMEKVELPKIIIRNFNKLGLKANEWHLFSLINYLESEGQPVPPQDELAKMMGLSERQLKQIVASLKSKGLLLVNRNKNAKKKYNFKPLYDRAMSLERQYQHQLTS